MIPAGKSSLAVDTPEDAISSRSSSTQRVQLLMSLSKYKNIIFDCDGVIFSNSSKIKSNAFYEVALNYTDESGAKKLFDFTLKEEECLGLLNLIGSLKQF